MSLIPSIFGNRIIFDPFSSDIWAPLNSNDEISTFANAQIDWKETPEAHVIRADLPGLKKEEVKVEIEEGRVLQLSGERSVEKEDKNEKWHRIERGRGKFLRRFRLPENAKVDEVKATMENGVLTMTMPKVEEKKTKLKSIDISN
ncbi:HSP20-like chaperones superfamily protein [Theobroma cacao]|uniref:HSP20-like chaperones superfamily protein n=1 Tax=Theobroma cacao TaxID=3641 RepID=A0A061EYK4_THECC|nr:HSP20-like chaperones superfamily protein [Theobroma cacao]